MVKIHYLGTCSGTEPFPDMHHCSWVLEVKGINYWFDCGENCAHRAHTSGINVLNTAAIFVSHAHYDHTGGMVNLLGCMAKLCSREKRNMVRDNSLTVCFPEMPVLQAIKTVFWGGSTGKNTREFPFQLEEREIADGVIFKDENICVTALHNKHLKEDGAKGWHSFSFLIETEGKRIVFSGDVANVEEVNGLIGNGCDLFIMETGHHRVTDVCEYAISRNVRKLRFNHHGREILNERKGCEQLVEKYSLNAKIDIKLCFDGMTEEI